MTQKQLPTQWKTSPLSEIVEIIRGITYKKAQSAISPEEGLLPVLRANNIQKGKIVTSELVYVPKDLIKSHQKLKAGDIVVAMSSGSKSVVGKTAKVESDFDGSFGAFCGVLRTDPECSANYVFWFTHSLNYRNRISSLSAGANINNLKPSHFEEITLPIAPFAEQKVIADKLDTLLAQVENTKARLERIPKILKRFRQSVLGAAMSGRLTEEWRELKQVRSDWRKVSFSDLLLQLRSGAAEKPNDDPEGVPILRSSAVRPMDIDFNDVRYLTKSDQLKADNFLKTGDLLFTRLSGSAEYVGNCAMVKHVYSEYQYPDRLFCARLKEPKQGPFLEYFFASQEFRDHIVSSLKSSAGHQRITLDVIKTAALTLPSIEEQTEIVRQVDQLFAHADRIEQQVKKALARVDNLTQSVLAKALSGALTEQWRKDNPELISGENSAEALLESIKAEPARSTSLKRKR